MEGFFDNMVLCTLRVSKDYGSFRCMIKTPYFVELSSMAGLVGSLRAATRIDVSIAQWQNPALPGDALAGLVGE